MKVLIAYVNEDEKLKNCLDSLKLHFPEGERVLLKVDKKKTAIAEELYQEWIDDHEGVDVMIFHPDMTATEDFANLMTIWKNMDFGITGLKILYPNGTVNHYGGAIRSDGVGCHPHQHTLDIGLTQPLDTTYVTGPGMIIQKELIAQFKAEGKKLWDFQFSYYVDVDFCFTAREMGFNIGVIPIRAIHSEGEDMAKVRPKEITRQMQIDCATKFNAKWMHTLAGTLK